ncbi:MAG: alpha/beta hydrolase [Sediminibacterium sp.]|jgi:pimeloyl-ACP methyl ester carboxylesterase
MEMKLAQRVVIGYYKTKLRTIGMVSPRLAAEQAFKIFCTPYTKGVHQKEPLVFHKAHPQTFRFEDLEIKGFHWIPEKPNGQKVLVVHGFSSYGYKFEKYVQPLLATGFEVFMFDAPAHGLSEGKIINALIYKKFLASIDQRFGKMDAFIAHSLGGLATSLLAEELEGKRKLVLIAPATETRTAVQGFYKMFKIKEPVRQEFEQMIERMTGKTMDHFSITRVMRNIQLPVLWIHDQQDRICPYADTLPVQKEGHPHIRFYITEGLGHNKIYRDQQVIKHVIGFLTEGSEYSVKRG